MEYATQKVEKQSQNQIDYKSITQKTVLDYDKPTDDFLCPLSANHYNIQFLYFKIRDYESNKVFFEIQRDQQSNEVLTQQQSYQFKNKFEEKEIRTVRYQFGEEFFNLKSVGTLLKFSVGDKPVKKFTMIERHYFRDKLIKSYDFTFPFCMPNTTNEWEAIYDVPQLSPELIQEMKDNPFDTTSDSFYFVGDELVMHNKAEYSYQ